jgi:predicted O-methyltransferase YrrM
MQVEELASILAGIPYMTPEQGEEISKFIREHDARNCLELGFAHGVGTAYIANAVNENGGGRIVAIDVEDARARNPDIFTTLAQAHVSISSVEIYFEATSYTWRMMRFLEEGQTGKFDFVYLDGAHSWFVDGLAVLLAERLLRPGGWLLCDDLDWTFNDPGLRKLGLSWVERMPEEERQTPQIRKVWKLLIKSNPSFDLLIERGDWGYARKALDTGSMQIIKKYHPLMDHLLALKTIARKVILTFRR